jgi:hypothetical protein
MIHIVLLEYLEPDFKQTIECVLRTGLPYTIVSRDGVGNMSRAYNTILNKHINAKYVWFVSNITFDSDVPNKLAETLESTGWAACHPIMKSSDHQFQWEAKEPKATPFIEWTAPMVRYDSFKLCCLDEMLPYYYMDLDWCYRIRPEKVGIAPVEIQHTYLRNKKEHPIGQIRKQLRNYWTPLSQHHMVQKYGKDWQNKLWPK